VSTELVGQWPAHASREQITDGATEPDHPPAHDEALDFVRFCYRRRHVAWPDLYDEMCAGRLTISRPMQSSVDGDTRSPRARPTPG
jgi:hypothetical protein